MRRRDPAIAAAVRALARSWRIRIWAAIAAVLGLVLWRLPLFGVPGYEQALVTSLLASFAGLALGASFARTAARMEATALDRAVGPWRLVAAIAWRAMLFAAAIAAIPGAVVSVHAFWTPVCDWEFALRAQLLLPITTAVLAAGAGVAIGLAVPRPGWCWGALALLWLAVATAALWRFFSEPPVFSYDAIVGFFPGNLYDEDLTLGWTLVWSRLEQLAAVGAMLAAVAVFVDAPTLRVRLRDRRPSGFRTFEVVVALVLAGGAGLLHWRSGALGYAVDAADIEDELDGTRVTPHFVIHYARRADIEDDMDLIAADHEFRYAQVARALGVELDGKIDSYYFADSDQKARLMGARSVEMAKPWRREIYLHHDDFPHGSLRHEIAHVVAGSFGSPLLRLSARRVFLINPGLIEGLAVATDWPGRYDTSLTPHQAVRAMTEAGLEPSLSGIMSLGFLSVSPARSYTTGGSFVRFLLERYGAPALRELYGSGGDFGTAYGKSEATLEAEWRTMLDGISLPPDAVEQSREVFRHPSVFEAPCPHAIAAREAEAVERSNHGDRAGAIALLRRVCSDDPDEPSHQLVLARTLAGGDPAEHQEARAIWTRIANDAAGVTAPLRAQAFDQLGRLAAGEGDLTAAEQMFVRGAALPAGLGERRQLEAFLLGLRHTGPAAAALRGYFFDKADQFAWASLLPALEPSFGFGWYLRGLQRILHGQHAAAAVDLAHALELGLPGPRFVSNAARQLAVSAWRAGDTARVARAADVLASTGNEVERLLAEDWRERIDFAVTGALPTAGAPR